VLIKREENNNMGVVSVESGFTYEYEDTNETLSSGMMKQSGDYDVLNQSVREHRQIYRRAHLDLGSSLHHIGEHHVRNKEYSRAMTAFTEAYSLRCKASGFNPEVKEFNLQSPCTNPENEDGQSEIDAVLSTISSMGNVYSLLGEQAEAMKCYTDIMTIRASFSNVSRDVQQIHSCASGEASSEVSTIESELSEDVKALDDLFRSISFRDMETKPFQRPSKDSNEPRESMTPHFSPITIPIEPDVVISEDITTTITTSTNPSAPSDPSYYETELKEALEMYRGLLDNYSGEDLRVHQADYSQIIREVDSLSAGVHQQDTNDTKSNDKCLREKSLYMAIIVQDRIRTAQQAIADSLASKVVVHDDSILQQQQTASINVASTMIRIGSLHYKLANVDEELHMYNQALTTYTKALGEKHSYVAGTRKNIGMVLAERSDYNAAMEQFNKARSIYSHISKGDMSDDVASALLCMGNVQSRRSEYDNALSLYSKALHIYRTLAEESVWSASSIDKVTSTLKIIGMVYAKRDDLPSAMKCFNEALDLLNEDEAGETASNGVGVASIRTRMGGIYYKKGQYEDAMAQYHEAYKVASTTLGTKIHPDVAGIIHYIGVVYQKRSDFEKAMSCYGKSVAIYRTTLGPDNPIIATTLVCIGSIHYRRRNLDKALEFYKEAYRIYENSYGPHHPQVAPTLKSVAMIHTKKGEYDEAMEIFITVLRLKSDVVGSCNPEVANAYKSIANIHLKRGEFGEALRHYKHSLDIYERTVGENHPDVKLIRDTIVVVREHIAKNRRSCTNSDQRNMRPNKRRVVSSSRFSM